MEVAEVGGFGANYAYLYFALQEAVEEYQQRKRRTEMSPPVPEETGGDLIRLYYALDQARATVILLAAACVEAIANVYLAMKTTPEQFAVLESAAFIEKWMVLPTLFLQGYVFPKGSTLAQDLKLLHDRRNGLLHMKAMVTKGGVVIHKGTRPTVPGDEDAFIKRCASLPIRLIEHVASFDPAGAVAAIHFTLSAAQR